MKKELPSLNAQIREFITSQADNELDTVIDKVKHWNAEYLYMTDADFKLIYKALVHYKKRGV